MQEELEEEEEEKGVLEVLAWPSEKAVLAMTRPLGGSRPLELEVWSSKDARWAGYLRGTHAHMLDTCSRTSMHGVTLTRVPPCTYACMESHALVHILTCSHSPLHAHEKHTFIMHRQAHAPGQPCKYTCIRLTRHVGTAAGMLLSAATLFLLLLLLTGNPTQY